MGKKQVFPGENQLNVAPLIEPLEQVPFGANIVCVPSVVSRISLDISGFAAKIGGMAKIAPAVTLSDPDRAQLQRWVRAQFTPQQVVLRSRILLLAADGKENLAIAAELKVNRHTPAL